MHSERQGFPDDRDRALQHYAQAISDLADDLVEWGGSHITPRRGGEHEIGEEAEFSLYRLRRLAANLRCSADVPVAAAVYGASQVGKSLFMGRVLEPAHADLSPLGADERRPAPAYIPELSFKWDINPACGGNEATALVTRFTTKERFDPDALPEFPVKVRALTRSEWLRVMARGYRSECRQQNDHVWREGQLRALFEEISRDHGAETVEREWRIDLLDAYAYLRRLDPRQFEASESLFNSFLSQYPLSDPGYVALAGRLFWDSAQFPALTRLFSDVCAFLRKIKSQNRDRDGILVHWAAVKFLLDSQRTPTQESPHSAWLREVRWADIKAEFRDGWYVLDYQPSGNPNAKGPDDKLATIQSAMLELILPVIPHRLQPDWRDVLLRMDLLDLPGMRSGRSESAGGATEIGSVEAEMNVVKRGKVFYLIDRYIEERQIQSLLLLVRGGLLEVRQLLKEYIDRWGRAHYGEQRWPRLVPAENPALLIGLTGIDADFLLVEPHRQLYENRLNQLVNETLYEVMRDFGGEGRPFTNCFPIRYPGTWDCDATQRQGKQHKWELAKQYYLDSPLVQRHIAQADLKWEVAMQDDDGGLSLICRGFVASATSRQKQDALHEQLRQVGDELLQLAEGWYCDPSANADRQRRREAAEQVLSWLEDESRVYCRVHALQAALTFDEGDAMQIAEFAETRGLRSSVRPETIAERFPRFLREILANWGRELAAKRWHVYVTEHTGGAPWLESQQFGALGRYLAEYLTCDGVFDELSRRLLEIVSLKIRDAGDRRHAQRDYVRVILNDFVLNPGPDDTPLEPTPEPTLDLGLMKSFVQRWRSRLPEALASVAGDQRRIPSGNEPLRRLLDMSRARVAEVVARLPVASDGA